MSHESVMKCSLKINIYSALKMHTNASKINCIFLCDNFSYMVFFTHNLTFRKPGYSYINGVTFKAQYLIYYGNKP